MYVLLYIATCQVAMYTMFKKKLHPFYICNNFFIREPIFIIFGKNVAKLEIAGCSFNRSISIDNDARDFSIDWKSKHCD